MKKNYPHIIKLFTDIDPKNGEAWALDSIQKYNSFKNNIFKSGFNSPWMRAWSIFASLLNHLYRNRHAKNRT